MKKLLLFSPILMFSCMKSYDVQYNNPTNTDLYVVIEGEENGFEVKSFSSEMNMQPNGNFNINVHSKMHYTDYNENIKLDKENIVVTLHK